MASHIISILEDDKASENIIEAAVSKLTGLKRWKIKGPSAAKNDATITTDLRE